MLRTLASMVPGTHLLKLLFLTRYINCLCNLSRLPLGEGAERSEAEEGNASYVFKIYEGEILCQKIQI